jgi:ferrochelatase
MSKNNKKTAVILFNLGGPESLDLVEPFLFNLFNDKAIIGLPQPFRFILAKIISKSRVQKSQKIYSAIGGKSPLLEITNSQAHSLEKELSFFGDYKVFVVMRYTSPRASEVIQKVLDYRPTNTILLPLYPQNSTTTTGSSVSEFSEKFVKACKRSGAEIPMKFVCCYPEDPDFIKSHALLIKQTLMKLYDQFDRDLTKFRFLFSAHGLPQKIINEGDPYVFQVEKTTAKTVENLSQLLEVTADKIDSQICYQSKVGPMQWTGPSLDLEMRRAVLDQKIPVVIPIAFVSEHSETLVELDIDYKHLAESLGAKNYLRVPALNSDGHFIKALTEICKKTNSDSSSSCFSGRNSERICPKKFVKCPNLNFCEK